MSQIVTLEIPDVIYVAVKQAAEAAGQTPDIWIVTNLRQQFPAHDAEQLRRETDPEIYKLLEQIAPSMGKTTEELVIEWHAKYGPKPRPQLTEEEWEAARQRLLRHAGAASLGYPTGADNESIDADLAHEYASTHDEEE